MIMDQIKYIYDSTNDEFHDIMDVGEAYIFDDLNLDAGWLTLCLVLYDEGYRDFDGMNAKIDITSLDSVIRWAVFNHKDKDCRVLQFQIKPVKGCLDMYEWVEEHILSEIKDAQDKIHVEKFEQSLVI